MATHHLDIERFSLTCLVAPDQPHPEQVRDRLDEVAARLGSALGDSLAAALDAQGDGVCLIRRVELDLALNADATVPELRAVWAQAIAVAIARRLSGDGDGVVRFSSRAAQLAHFLDRLAAGDAWSLWYHRRYAGLCALPDAMAARTALLADAATGLASLQLLDGWARQRLFGVLGPAECCRVLVEIAAIGVACNASGETIAQALPTCRTGPALTEAAALELYVALATASGMTPGLAAAALVRAVATVRAKLACGDTALLAALAQGALAQSALAGDMRSPIDGSNGSDAAGAGRLQLLDALPAAQRSVLAQALGAAAAPQALDYTGHGGIFLLLDGLDAVLPTELDAWPDCHGAQDGMPAAPLLRLLVLANGLGAQVVPLVLQEPLWRALFKLPARLCLRDVGSWCAALPAHRLARWSRQLPRKAPLPAWPPAPARVSRLLGRAAGALLQGFARHLTGFGDAGARHLRENFLSIGARVERSGGALTATLARPPLDVILAMSTLSAATLELSWLTPPLVHLRRSNE